MFRESRYAIRRLLKNPGFTLLATATLALGIGLNTAVFSIVDAVLLAPLPVEAPEQLVNVYTAGPEGGLGEHQPMAFPDYLDVAEASQTLDSLASYTPTGLVIEREDVSEMLFGELASANYFETLGVRPALGRGFLPEDDRREAEPVTVLGHRTWQQRFGGDPAVLGQALRLNGHEFTIVGVAPEGFQGLMTGLAPELWVPIQLAPRINASSIANSGEPTPGMDRLDDRGRQWHWVVGRLAEGATHPQANAEVQTLAQRLTEQYPDSNGNRRLSALPTESIRIFPGFDGPVAMASGLVMALVGLVLLIACSNLANMLLAQAVARGKEIATRLALGAGRGALVRQLLVESLALSSLGGALGLVLAVAVQKSLGLIESPLPIDMGLDLGLNPRVVVFTLAISTLTALFFGLFPARAALGTNLASTLHDAARGTSVGRGGRRLRRGLVVAQVALSLLLLICAGLSVRSMANAHRIDPGFEPEGVVVARLAPQLQGYDEARAQQLYEDLEERLAAIPGTTRVATASHLPLTFNISMEPAVAEGESARPIEEWTIMDTATVSPGYFEALGIELLRGRVFDHRDRADAPQVAVINETFAQRLWPDSDALGQRFHIDALTSVDEDSGNGGLLTVVGVVGDGKYRTLGERSRPFFYRTTEQNEILSRTLVLRSTGPQTQRLGEIRQAVRELDDRLAITGLETLEQATGVALTLPRATAALFGAFGLVGLLLAIVGLYGVIAYTVSRRTQELGIRMALGARRWAVVRLVLREGLGLATWGIVFGLAAAFAITRVLGSVLYGISATDALTFALVPLLLATIAACASAIPAYRASRLDPLVALRHE